MTYDLNELNKNLQAFSWSIANMQNCPTITYEVLDFPALSAADPTVFSISSDSLFAFTADTTKLGDYQLAIRGSSGNQVNALSNDFKVSVTNNCPGATITKI